MKQQKKDVRLSPYVLPIRYDLTLQPDFASFVFSGEETVLLQLEKPTKSITMHAVNLKIKSATVVEKKETKKAKVSFDKKAQTVTFTFSNALPKGKVCLHIVFSGMLSDTMTGFYRSKYEHNGKEEYIATTQFESTHAREAFPCIDEPAKKAIFRVKLIIPKDMTAISNTLEETTAEENGFAVVTFADSPKMSTYLLAFVIGKFEYIEGKTKEGVKVRVFVTPGKKKQAAFALDVACKTLSYFQKFFAIPYPLPTMDLIAIPDFAAGAMENWGAVTYRETALLVDPENSSTVSKQYVALVIAHELAHQWFGNLVTMEWWTHLWLNEGFASYIEYLALDHLFPEWYVWTQFVLMDHAEALKLDSLKNTHPIEVPVSHPDEINEIFDAVSYSKGASIIRMLAEYIGEENFRKGLQHYLKKFAYKNARTEDLWKSLEIVSKKPVGTIMKQWTGKAGYPVIQVHEKGDNVVLTQRRFFESPISRKEVHDTTTWSVPISVVTPKQKKPQFTLLNKKSISVPMQKTPWMKLNANEVSFVRVQYPATYLEQLHKPVAEKSLSAEDRFGIVRDAFALAQAGETSSVAALGLLPAYKQEDNYIVWAEIAGGLGTMANLFAEEPWYDEYKTYGRELFSDIAKRVGWEKKKGEAHFDTLLRSVVLFSAGHYGDAQVIKKVQTLFDSVTKDHNPIMSDLRTLVYTLSAENGGEKEYKKLRTLYAHADMQEEKDRIARSLCAFQQKHLLQETLEFGFSKEMRAQDAFRVITFSFANPKGRDVTWEFVKKHWDEISKKFSGGHLLPRFIKPASNFTREEDAKAVQAFFKTHKAPGGERTIAQTIEQIKANALWLQRDREPVRSFLGKE